ncbi:MAG: DUF488 domain-containing protein [Victivallaceae bacterium]
MPKEKSSPLVMTIGHSTHTIEEFINLLQAHGATCIVDVRTVPGSRYNPQFNKDSLSESLKEAGLEYVHMPGLGGLRHTKNDSLNIGWRNASFRGYADYMQTLKFAQSLEELIQMANRGQIVLMCAEAVPWRCHRSLIADALLVRGIRTEDIMSLTSRQTHKLTPFAKVLGTQITYPGEDSGNTPEKLTDEELPVLHAPASVIKKHESNSNNPVNERQLYATSSNNFRFNSEENDEGEATCLCVGSIRSHAGCPHAGSSCADYRISMETSCVRSATFRHGACCLLFTTIQDQQDYAQTIWHSGCAGHKRPISSYSKSDVRRNPFDVGWSRLPAGYCVAMARCRCARYFV